MFNNSRYMTRGVQEEVSLDLQLLLWQLIDDCKAKGLKLDYLQVFELSTETIGGQPIKIVSHHQEEPPYLSTNHFTPISASLDTKIWVIDDGEHSTMLFPSEYWGELIAV